MTAEPFFPSLDGFEPTRKTLHLYAQAIGSVPRAHGIAHPQWWHISLKVRPDGLETDNVPLPGGGSLALGLDLHRHRATLKTSRGDEQSFSLTEGLTGTEMGDQIIAAVARYGLEGDYARDKFESDEPRVYRPALAECYLTAVVNAERAFQKHRVSLGRRVGPIQVWPHGFDLAFEWFGTRVETHEEHGQVQEHPSQINLGFYPGNDGVAPYFYSNPWPFETEQLVDRPLPAGARWFTDSWQGTILDYQDLVGVPDAEDRLLAYARAVHNIAAPTLTTG